MGAHLCSLAGAVMLSLIPTPVVAAFALALIGMGYGFVSGLVAGAIARILAQESVRIHRQPAVHRVVRGCDQLPCHRRALFDRTGGYAIRSARGRGINVLGVLVARGLPAR
jgi:hypothetical protein